MHIPNFINSGIDYDPGFSVLFEGSGSSGGGSGRCGEGSDDYTVTKDGIFWASVSCAILACIIVLFVVILGSTNKGFELIRGRKTVQTMRRSLRNSRGSSGEFSRSNSGSASADTFHTYAL